MARQTSADQRTGARYLASLLVRVEWDTEQGKHMVAEGKTETSAPKGRSSIYSESCRMLVAACS